jgi:hypothetical protein
VPILERTFLFGLAPKDLVVTVGVEWRIDVNQIDAGGWQFRQLFEVLPTVNDAGINNG